MSGYLEQLKADLAEAQKRLQEAQAKMQAYQLIFQAAHADVQSYQRVVDAQTKKEQAAAEQVFGPREAPAAPAPTAPESPAPGSPAPGVNKTDLIREALRQHPGATPADLFEVVRGQVGRAYLYSVLKRLRENEEVMIRRKKYWLRAISKPEQGTEDGQRVN